MAMPSDSQAPGSGEHKKKRVTKTRKARQAAIQEIILLEGLTKPGEITVKLKERGFVAERHSVSADIEHMLYDDEFWLQALTKSVWVAECRNQYLEVKQDIKETRELIKKYHDEEMAFSDEGFNWASNPYTPKEEPENYLKFENIRAKAYGSYMRKYTKGVEIAQLRNSVVKNREWLQQFIKDLPLYWKLKQLANWVDLNKPKDQNIVSPVPEMEVLNTANQ